MPYPEQSRRDPRRGRPGALLLAIALLGGCPVEPEPEPPDSVSLIDLDDWQRVGDPAGDVFADQRPADAVCDDAGYVVDPLRQVFEIQTEVCDYLTVSQPTLEPLAPGDVVTVLAYHDMLTAPEPAEGYLGLALDGQIEWEYMVAIPASAATIEQQFTIDRALPVGTELQMHVHNHGPNTWELVDVLVTPAD